MSVSSNSLSRKFLIVWLGQLISAIGSGLTAFALGVFAYRQTHSATVYSLIILFAFLPSFVLRPIGGAFADRCDRRLLIILGDLGSATGLVFILTMMSMGINDIWAIYVGVAISSIFVALQNPAYKASVTDLVQEDSYSKASGLIQLAESSRYLISPIIAGFLLNSADIKSILVIDIATFLVAVLTVSGIKKNIATVKTTKEKQSFLSDLSEGFKYTFSHRGLMWLLSITSVITFLIGYLQSLLGPMILDFTDSKTLGVMQTISASGMLIGSFFIGVFSKSKKQLQILSISLAISGLFYAALGISVNIFLVTAFGFIFFITLPFVNTSLDVLIRKNVDNQVQGRVWSIVSLITQFGMVIAFATAGILADNIFNPMFRKEGMLSSSLGKIIGVGHERGIAFMFLLAGIFVSFVAVAISRVKELKSLEE